MVLEGVHLVPGMLPRSIEGALVIECVLEIPDERVHSSHFFIRDLASEERRPVAKYLDSIHEIRRIQRYIVGRARKTGVPVIENIGLEPSIAALMELVVSGAEAIQERV
jgi:2-phosphoglycerate kinase